MPDVCMARLTKPLPATLVLQHFCLFGFSLYANAYIALSVNDGHLLPCKKYHDSDVLHEDGSSEEVAGEATFGLRSDTL